MDHFAKYFTEAGLKELSDFLRVQQSLGTRKELQKELQERLSQECPIKEVKSGFFYNFCLYEHSERLESTVGTEEQIWAPHSFPAFLKIILIYSSVHPVLKTKATKCPLDLQVQLTVAFFGCSCFVCFFQLFLMRICLI